MDWTTAGVFTASILTILNPIGNTAIFGSMMGGRPHTTQRAVAIKCALAVAVILIGTIWVGEYVLALFGVSLPALEAAGGVIIAMIALSMLKSKQSEVHSTGTDDTSADDAGAGESVAVVPLAMPMVAGPGAIATVLVNTHTHDGLQNNLLLSAVCFVGAVSIAVCFLLSGFLVRALGPSGMSIVTKFMGMILLAIALAMLASGLKELLPGLAAA